MGKRIFNNNKPAKTFDDDKGTKVFDGIKPAKLGTEKNPAVVSVQTEKRVKEIDVLCKEHGWTCSIERQPDKPEDTADIERLLHPQKPTIAETKIGRNDPCPCGSGRKYKKCCGK